MDKKCANSIHIELAPILSQWEPCSPILDIPFLKSLFPYDNPYIFAFCSLIASS